MFDTEQVAWIVAKYPHISGYALKYGVDFMLDSENPNEEDKLFKIIVGKRKPFLRVNGNEQRIEKYKKQFEELIEKYK